MKIAVLAPSYEQSNSPFKGHDPFGGPARYLEGVKNNNNNNNHKNNTKDSHDGNENGNGIENGNGNGIENGVEDGDDDPTWEYIFVNKATAVQQVRDLARKKECDVVINMCDGAFDEDRAGVEVIHALDLYRLPYTGGDVAFYNVSKEIMKLMAVYYGVNTAPYVFAYDEKTAEEAATTLTFPLIVKHYNGYASIGMTRASKCWNAEELRIQARKMIHEYGGALIEEFIDGREFTVLATENPEDPDHPIAFVPVECFMGKDQDNFKHFDVKWLDFGALQWRPVKEEPLATQLKEMGTTMFKVLKGVSYGRSDIRMNSQGELFFLEMNPNCGIFYPPDEMGSADYILKHDPLGHPWFIKHIIKCALLRHKNQRQPHKISYSKCRGGFALRAGKDIQAGELIDQHEEHPVFVVSRSHVDTTWDPLKKTWFQHYAYPLTDELWAMWSDDPKNWRPINHSCNPNAWLCDQGGLNMIARYPIKKGEEITLDYATFCIETMPDFKCECNSVNCRRMFRGNDYLQPWISEVYGNHLSDYVKTKRKQKINLFN